MLNKKPGRSARRRHLPCYVCVGCPRCNDDCAFAVIWPPGKILGMYWTKYKQLNVSNQWWCTSLSLFFFFVFLRIQERQYCLTSLTSCPKINELYSSIPFGEKMSFNSISSLGQLDLKASLSSFPSRGMTCFWHANPRSDLVGNSSIFTITLPETSNPSFQPM